MTKDSHEGSVMKGRRNEAPSTPEPAAPAGAQEGDSDDKGSYSARPPIQDAEESPLQVLFYVLLRDYVAGQVLERAIDKTVSILRGSGYALPTDFALDASLHVRAHGLASIVLGAMSELEQISPEISSAWPDRRTYIEFLVGRARGIENLAHRRDEYDDILKELAPSKHTFVLALAERVYLLEQERGGMSST